MPGWKPAHGPTYFPFPDFPTKTDTNITPYRNGGASTRQVLTVEAGGIRAKPPNQTGLSVLVTPFSFDFTFLLSVRTARYFHFTNLLVFKHKPTTSLRQRPFRIALY